VLKLLTELKQICNHPAQYLGERGPLPGRSGKLTRAVELLGEVVEAGDRALVFTQYRRMGELLARHLAKRPCTCRPRRSCTVACPGRPRGDGRRLPARRRGPAAAADLAQGRRDRA
jgi:hypothetical protein